MFGVPCLRSAQYTHVSPGCLKRKRKKSDRLSANCRSSDVIASLRRFGRLKRTQYSSDDRASEQAVPDFKHSPPADRRSTTSRVSDEQLPLLPRPVTTYKSRSCKLRRRCNGDDQDSTQRNLLDMSVINLYKSSNILHIL